VVRRAAVWVVSISLAGCQQYRRSPIDTAEILAQWRARTAQSDPVRELATARGTTYDLADGMSADEAVATALVLNPQLRASRRSAAVESAGLKHVAPFPNPELNVDARRVLDGAGGWQLETSLGVVIPLSGRRGAEQDRAKAAVEAARLEILEEEWELERSVRRAWVRWSAADRRVTLLQEYGRAIKPLQTAADALAKAGEIIATQAAVLAVDRLEREEEAVEAVATEEALRHELFAQLGLKATTPVQLVASLHVSGPTAAAAEDGAVIQRDHPAVRAALARYEVAEQRVRTEIAKQFPDLVLGPSFELDDGQSSVGLGLGLPIPAINLNKRGIARARAERAAGRARVVATVEALLTHAGVVRARVSRASSRAQRLTERLMPAVEAQLTRLGRLAADGELDPLLVRHFLDRAHAARLALLEAQVDAALATVDLRALVTPPTATEAQR